MVTCGVLNSTDVTQSFSIGYPSTQYALVAVKLGTTFAGLTNRFVEVALSSSGVVKVVRTDAGLYSGQGVYVVLAKIA